MIFKVQNYSGWVELTPNISIYVSDLKPTHNLMEKLPNDDLQMVSSIVMPERTRGELLKGGFNLDDFPNCLQFQLVDGKDIKKERENTKLWLLNNCKNNSDYFFKAAFYILELENSLLKIMNIPLKTEGSDWEEIEEAQKIARKILDSK
jgi:hypothetical protein